jgi:hypothetical protein
MFVARFYFGEGEKVCMENFEKSFASTWPVPALVTPLSGSAMADAWQRCNPVVEGKDFAYPPGLNLNDTEKQQAASYYAGENISADALLFVGPRAQLTFAPTLSDYFMDSEYFQEIARHYLLQTEQKLDPPDRANYPMTPRFPNR